MIYNSKVIDFFKRHNMYEKIMFDYLQYNTIMIDYRDEDEKEFIGCFYVFLNGKLHKINLVLPYLMDDITTLINIHEITHGIYMYRYLDKKVTIKEDIEVLPMLYERIYINESNNKELLALANDLDKKIRHEDIYLLGLKLRDELLRIYNYDFEDINKKAKKLVKKELRNKHS